MAVANCKHSELALQWVSISSSPSEVHKHGFCSDCGIDVVYHNRHLL